MQEIIGLRAYIVLVTVDANTKPVPFWLSTAQTWAIGRDPQCEIALHPTTFPKMSRRHALIRPVKTADDGCMGWEIADLQSANGTFVNDRPVDGWQLLHHGDVIRLGDDEPMLLFHLETPAVMPETLTPFSVITDLTLTKLLPILSTGKQLLNRNFLYPMGLTLGSVILLSATVGHSAFTGVLALCIAGAAYGSVYRLCGKPKPWWLIATVMLTVALMLRSEVLQWFIWFFRQILPGSLPKNNSNSVTLAQIFLATFCGAGLMEELLKAVPILFIRWLMTEPWGIIIHLTKRKLKPFVKTFVKSPGIANKRQTWGITEPLDGIVLGTAAAVSFTLVETLGLYVPQIISNFTRSGQDLDTAQLAGLQLLIPRILGSVAGHMAYSGYFGYFIGLSALKPKYCWQILGTGYFSAALLHALWNSTALVSWWLLAIVGLLSYTCLIAAILKARRLSPKSPRSSPHLERK
jgi:RsiW-degrading membrane proteinase PrsW (M82 family)